MWGNRTPNHSIRHFIKIYKAIWDFPLKVINFIFQNKQDSFIYLHVFPWLLPSPKWLTCRGQARARSCTRGCSVPLNARKSRTQVAPRQLRAFAHFFWCSNIPTHKLSFATHGAKLEGFILTSTMSAAFFECRFATQQPLAGGGCRAEGVWGRECYFLTPSLIQHLPPACGAAVLNFSLSSGTVALTLHLAGLFMIFLETVFLTHPLSPRMGR